MGEICDQHGQERAAKEPKSLMTRFRALYRFLSSKLGLVIIAGVIALPGSFLTVLASDREHRLDQQSALSEERAKDLASLHGTLGRAIIEREIATDALLAAVSYGATGEEIESLWNKYLDSYRLENEIAEGSQELVTGHPEDDPAPANPTGMEDFWYFLDVVIQSRFDSMHRCLLAVHAAYVDGDGSPENRLSAAKQELSVCETDGGWNHKAYFDPSTKRSVNMARWDNFKICIEDYVDLEDLNARLQRRVWQSNESFWDNLLSRATACNQNTIECKDSKATCFQARFLATLDSTLEASCGRAVKGYN